MTINRELKWRHDSGARFLMSKETIISVQTIAIVTLLCLLTGCDAVRSGGVFRVIGDDGRGKSLVDFRVTRDMSESVFTGILEREISPLIPSGGVVRLVCVEPLEDTVWQLESIDGVIAHVNTNPHSGSGLFLIVARRVGANVDISCGGRPLATAEKPNTWLSEFTLQAWTRIELSRKLKEKAGSSYQSLKDDSSTILMTGPKREARPT